MSACHFVCVCVFLLCSGWEVGNNNPSLDKHIQCGLNDTQRASEKKRLECVRLTQTRADLEMEFST